MQLQGILQTIVFTLGLIVLPLKSMALDYPKDTDLTKISSEHAAILMTATYAGLGNYCWAYGIDYRELSAQLNAGAQANSQLGEEIEYLIWMRGFAAGSIGKLFSQSAQVFIDVASVEDIASVCDQAYVQALKISRTK